MTLAVTNELTVGKDVKEMVLQQSLEIIKLGKQEGRMGQNESVLILRFVGEGGKSYHQGVFVSEKDEPRFKSWLDKGSFKSVADGQLNPLQLERLKQFSTLDIPPANISYLALDTDEDFENIRDNFPPFGKGNLEPMLGIASEQSGQGKTFLAVIESLKWGDAVVSGDIFSADNAERLVAALTKAGWSTELSEDDVLQLFRASRNGAKLDGQGLPEFNEKLWKARCEHTGLLLVDQPGMKKSDDGGDTRPTNGFDTLRWAIPTYVIPGNSRPDGQKYDLDYSRVVVEGFYNAIRDTWNLDKQRVAGLRKLLE